MNKKIYRSVSDVKICGVCGGIGEYFGIDTTIVRLLWVLGTLMNLFLGVVIYIACVFIVPQDPGCIDAEYNEKE